MYHMNALRGGIFYLKPIVVLMTAVYRLSALIFNMKCILNAKHSQ